jgi:redox-sensitive bicupin YhaK (pirin superfamily)
MITIHEKAVRGHTRSGWLDSFHTFSFGSFQDPNRMGFGNLRVLNEDTIIAGSGFAPHRHENMDILTYVLSGQLRHEDDRGNVAIIPGGEAQLMSAGEGIEHSERNASNTQGARFLQIWLIPDHAGGAPIYAQKAVPLGGDVALAGPAGANALLELRSETTVRLVRATEGDRTSLDQTGAPRFLHLIDGMAFAEDERISAGDGLQLPTQEATSLDWATDGAALLFDMPRKPRVLQ